MRISGMAKGLGDYKLIEIEGGYETLFIAPGRVAEGVIKALRKLWGPNTSKG